MQLVTAKSNPSNNSRWGTVDADAYDAKWEEMQRNGHNPHGEVDFVCRFSPSFVLDAGCGSGRVAIELAARGIDVAGVDLDAAFIDAAQQKAPDLDFVVGDLSTIRLGRTFDVVVMAGNVMVFVAPGTEAEVVRNLATHLSPGGRLIAGFQLDRGLSIDGYKHAAATAGLELEEHWATWNGDSASASDSYGVLVHRAPPLSGL